MHALDNPTWAAITGPCAHLAQRRGRAGWFLPEVSPFGAVDDPEDPDAWLDLTAPALIAAPRHRPPEAIEQVSVDDKVQMVGTNLRGAPDPEAVPLTGDDVADVLDLVARTRPGPFAGRTIDFGGYQGIRRDGTLIAMAGERLRFDGWTEISAVATDPAFRGQGLAARLIRAVAAPVQQRGETPFLHARAINTNAIRLYEHLGFTMRVPITFASYRPRTAP